MYTYNKKTIGKRKCNRLLFTYAICVLFTDISLSLAHKVKDMTLISRYWNWCRRFRHRCGYGVHSPADFFLITSVIYEKCPYYAYAELQKKRFSAFLPHYRQKVNRLLFRLVNYLKPQSLIEVGVGNGASISYMRAVSKNIQSYTLKGRDEAKTLEKLEHNIKALGRIDFLHIAHTPHYKAVFEKALLYVKSNSCIVIGKPYLNKEKKLWWKQLLKDERVILTFDLYDIGLVFFDKKRVKQNYKVNFL